MQLFLCHDKIPPTRKVLYLNPSLKINIPQWLVQSGYPGVVSHPKIGKTIFRKNTIACVC